MTLFGSKDTPTAQQQRPRRGPNPMQFPEEGSIPLTEKELRAEGITYCLGQIQSHYQCLARARVRMELQTESVLGSAVSNAQICTSSSSSTYRNHTWQRGWIPTKDLNGTIITLECALTPTRQLTNASLIIAKWKSKSAKGKFGKEKRD
jgi:hypothetical protein